MSEISEQKQMQISRKKRKKNDKKKYPQFLCLTGSNVDYRCFPGNYSVSEVFVTFTLFEMVFNHEHFSALNQKGG